MPRSTNNRLLHARSCSYGGDLNAKIYFRHLVDDWILLSDLACELGLLSWRQSGRPAREIESASHGRQIVLVVVHICRLQALILGIRTIIAMRADLFKAPSHIFLSESPGMRGHSSGF